MNTRMVVKVCLACLLLLAAFGAVSPAGAQISVDRVIVNFQPGERPIENIVVRNTGADPFLVTVVPEKMVDPGTKNEHRIPADDLIVSPKRFSVTAGGQRTVRMVMKSGFGDTERVYRIKFLPEAKAVGEEEPAAGRRVLLKVVTGVGILLFANPTTAHPSLKHVRKADGIEFTNDGNVNIFLTEGKACRKDSDKCTDLPVNRLYAGNTFYVPVPAGATVTYRKETQGQFETLEIPAQ